MSFKAIETQEELDRIIGERVAKEKERLERNSPFKAELDQLKTAKADLENQVGTLQSTIEQSKAGQEDYTKQISDLTSKVAGYETANLRTRIALQNGLPFDLADRLVGEDEESIKADAERLSSFVTKQHSAPLKDVEPNIQKDENSAYRKLVDGLKTEGE